MNDSPLSVERSAKTGFAIVLASAVVAGIIGGQQKQITPGLFLGLLMLPVGGAAAHYYWQKKQVSA